MSYLKFILIAALLALATAELNITLNADGTGFDATGLQKESVTRVINGHVARPGQIPWQATIFTLRQPQVWTFNSGALISRHFVVTLASSVRDSRETRVFLGSNQWGQGVQIFSTQTLFHPRSNTGNRLFDIAILRLNTPVTFSGLIRPIPLPADNLFNVRFDGQFVRLSGFGSMDQVRPFPALQWAELRVTRHEYCASRFPRIAGPLFFCAVNDRRTNARPGFGDLGAPLIWRHGNLDVLLGLANIGSPNTAQQGALSGYLNIAQHAPWLRAILHANP